MGGEDVGEVGAVEDVFEGWEDFHPDWGAVFAADESVERSRISTVRIFVRGVNRSATWTSLNRGLESWDEMERPARAENTYWQA